MTDTDTWVIHDHSRDKQRECNSRSEAEDTKQDMAGLGANLEDLEIVPPGESIDDGDTPGDDSVSVEPTTSDATVTEGAINAPEKEPPQEPVSASKTNKNDLPDRTLTDDPIEWLMNGADDLVTTIKNTQVITKKGFRVLQHHYDISTTSEVVVGPEETDDTFCRVHATAEMPDGRTAEAHASAHVDRGDDHFLLVSMADTRAKSRALSDITGVGAVAVEEMAGVDND
jgi:hypothetical protein